MSTQTLVEHLTFKIQLMRPAYILKYRLWLFHLKQLGVPQQRLFGEEISQSMEYFKYVEPTI